MAEKSYVFIGSSVEGRDVAEAIAQNLEPICECELWDQGVFGLSGNTLESLVNSVGKFDFAIFVITADDTTTSKEINYNSPRDNVIFEFGLFTGVLSRQRVFMVVDKVAKPKLPTDLAGITYAGFEYPEKRSLQAALGTAASKIKDQIIRLGLRVKTSSSNPNEDDLKIITRYLESKGMIGITFDGLIKYVDPKFDSDYILKLISLFPDKLTRARLKNNSPGIKILSSHKLIFKDTFDNLSHWVMNYWNDDSAYRSKTNRIEKAKMIFEALPSEVDSSDGYFGAFLDLPKILENQKTYEVHCRVSASANATMGFQLWIHDNKDDKNTSVQEPLFPKTPPVTYFETIKIRFTATASKTMRIHLHCKAGLGKIIISEVSVFEI